MMEPSQACIDLIKASENFEPSPYPDPAGIPTIGWGTTHYEDGTHVTLHDAPIDEARGEALLYAALNPIANQVNHYVQVAMSQGQFDALCDFAYNLGAQALRGSTLLRLLNSGLPNTAAKEFNKWVHADGRVMPGLVTRRAAEQEMFQS